jgi:hypothetical protein
VIRKKCLKILLRERMVMEEKKRLRNIDLSSVDLLAGCYKGLSYEVIGSDPELVYCIGLPMSQGELLL